jgi:hypothetical protein
MSTATLTSKDQTTIPKGIRNDAISIREIASLQPEHLSSYRRPSIEGDACTSKRRGPD